MALTRKFLSAMGIEPEKIDQIIEAHTETTEALKKERDSYKENAEKLAEVQTELDGLKTKSQTDSTYKEKYTAEHKAFEDFKKEVETKEIKLTKEKAYRELLKKAGISDKRLDAIMKVTNVDEMEADEKGAFKKVEELEKKIKEEWSDFIETKQQKGAEVQTPPANNGGNAGNDRVSQLTQKWHAALYGAPQAGTNNSNQRGE